MNDLTIIFFEQLSKRLNHAPLLIDRLRAELIQDTKVRFEAFLRPTTLYLSAGGREFSSRLDGFLRRAAAMHEIREIRALYKQLTALETEAQDLRNETLAALSSPGSLRADHMHILFQEEANNAAARLYAAVCLEMYRLAAAGGGEAVKKLPPLHYVHPDVPSYYQYYAKEVLPALSLMERSRRFGVWTFQYREQAKVGAFARLPAYVQAAPRADKLRLLPGEHRLMGSGQSEVWQGVGAITNLTPSVMQRAQKEGICSAVTTEQLVNCRLNGTPTQILDQCFEGRFYAVDPVHFFAVLSSALCARALYLRTQRGQCLFCGADSAGSSLCLSCHGKVRQKI